MDSSERLENINIDECKELFEYEMTEVILKLKGEFSTVSGCGKRYKDVAVDDADLVVAVGELHALELEGIRTDCPDVSAIKIPAIISSEGAEYHAQLEVLSSCPDTSSDGFNFSLQLGDSPDSKDVLITKIASFDDKKLYGTSSAAGECASSINTLGAEFSPIESVIPAIPSIGITGQIGLSECAIKKKSIDLPRTDILSDVRPVFSYEHSQIILNIPSETSFTPGLKFNVDLDYSVPNCSMPILPHSFSAIGKAAEKRVQLSGIIPKHAISVPSVGESVDAASRINGLSMKTSSSVRNAIEKVDASDFGTVPINASYFTKKMQKDGMGPSKMKTISVPHIPVVNK